MQEEIEKTNKVYAKAFKLSREIDNLVVKMRISYFDCFRLHPKFIEIEKELAEHSLPEKPSEFIEELKQIQTRLEKFVNNETKWIETLKEINNIIEQEKKQVKIK